MINLIKNKEVMFGVGPFVITRERAKVINYTNPMDIVGYTYLYNRPRPVTRATLFLKPYKRIVSHSIQLLESFEC